MTGEWDNWERCESGPLDADLTVLCLPGGMCAAMSYEELMAEPALAGVHLVAVTLPGHGGTPPPADLSVENYRGARIRSRRRARVRDAVVGFSMGANVAIEMVGSGAFTGTAVLLAPSFSRQDEAAFLRGIDHLSRVTGALPYSAMLRMVGMAVKGSELPPERLDALVGVLRDNDPKVVRQAIHSYLRYLDRYGSVADRLGEAGVPTWVVHGEKGDGGVTDEERATLDRYSSAVTMITISGTSFFMPNEEPTLVAGLVREALGQPVP